MAHFPVLRCVSGVTVFAVLLMSAVSCSGKKSPDSEPVAADNQEATRLDKAIADRTDAINADPKKVNDRGELPHYNRARLYVEKGDTDKAIADFTEAIRLYPLVNGPYLRARQVEAYSLRGDSYEKKGDHDKAIADYTEVIQLSMVGFRDLGDAMLYGGVAGNAHYKRGVCHDQKGDHEKALADYKEAIRLAPDLATNEDLKKRMSK